MAPKCVHTNWITVLYRSYCYVFAVERATKWKPNRRTALRLDTSTVTSFQRILSVILLGRLTIGQSRIQRSFYFSVEAGTCREGLLRLISANRFVIQQQQVKIF